MKSGTRHFARFWSRYAGSVAFAALLVIAALGFARVENARFEGCTNGNLLRKGLREAEQQNIAQIRATDPALFPQIAPSIFKELQAQAIERAVEHISVNYADRPCGTHIAVPLAGTIVLPLGG